ncbi:hypothetical protein A3SAC12_0045 [Lactobacillus phage 3-SAC12]|nr:hypothetical protein A3SAC12_0045 [Lactobacillus phage 3-SAC12]
MARNNELMDLVYKTENEYGSCDFWPQDLTQKIQSIANKVDEQEEVKNEALKLYQKGVMTTAIAKRVGLGMVKINKIISKNNRFYYTNKEKSILESLRGSRIKSVSMRMKKNVKWVKNYYETVKK